MGIQLDEIRIGDDGVGQDTAQNGFRQRIRPLVRIQSGFTDPGQQFDFSGNLMSALDRFAADDKAGAKPAAAQIEACLLYTSLQQGDGFGALWGIAGTGKEATGPVPL